MSSENVGVAVWTTVIPSNPGAINTTEGVDVNANVDEYEKPSVLLRGYHVNHTLTPARARGLAALLERAALEAEVRADRTKREREESPMQGPYVPTRSL